MEPAYDSTTESPETAHCTAFSRGKNQQISNTNILNAGRDINYIECNLPLSKTLAETILETFSFLRRPGLQLSGIATSSSPLESAVASHASVPGVVDQYVTGSNIELSNGCECNYDAVIDSQETHVEPFPGHRLSNCPTKALMRTPSSCELYIETMFPFKYGFPLWFPQPDLRRPLAHRRIGISIGDVGVITADGDFDFLFNIWLSSSDPMNEQANLPDDFDVPTRPRPRYRYRHSFNPGDSKISSLDVKSNINTSSSDISITCRDENKGAILALPDGAFQEDLSNEWDLKKFISENALEWYRYARLNCGIDLDRHSLYLVTGHMKSKTWGIATFDNVDPERNSTLVLGRTNATRKPYFTWKKSGGATMYKTGPSNDPGLISEDYDQEDTANQCLFVRGFKISVSERKWKEMWTTADVEVEIVSGKEMGQPSSDFVNRRAQNEGGTSGSRQCRSSERLGTNISVTSYPERGVPFHPLNNVNDMLFCLAPEACIAVTHDKLWTEMNHDSTAESFLEDLKSQYMVVLNRENSACSLEPNPIIIQRQSDPMTSVNIAAQRDRDGEMTWKVYSSVYQRNKKFVLAASDSESSDDEDENDEEVCYNSEFNKEDIEIRWRNETEQAQNQFFPQDSTGPRRTQSTGNANHNINVQRTRQEIQERRFAKYFTASPTDVQETSRSRSAGLLNHFFNPEHRILPPGYPYPRVFSSNEIGREYGRYGAEELRQVQLLEQRRHQQFDQAIHRQYIDDTAAHSSSGSSYASLPCMVSLS